MHKVLVVDDSAFMRQTIKEILEKTGNFEVSVAQTPLIALDKIQKQNFDVITVDYEMPIMNGIELIRRIREITKSNIIMISAYTQPGAQITLEALSEGAFDYVLKPTNQTEIELFSSEIIEKVTYACNCKKNNQEYKYTFSKVEAKKGLDIYEKAKLAKVVAIGISTGGPPALEYIFKSLKRDFRLPILVVQHMPFNFTKALAERLCQLTKHCIKEAENFEEIKDGCIYIAPGGKHMIAEKVEDNFFIRLLDTEKVSGHKPSADVLFWSISKSYKNRAIGIIMTGMGSDGAEGILDMKNMGAVTIAQDEKSSVVFGMPKVAIAKGAVDEVLSLDEIINFLNNI